MRKLMVWLMLSVLLLTLAPGAYAEGPFRVAGYDPEAADHDWPTNLFFTRMQEKTGVELTLEQYETNESWQAAKAAMLSGEGELPDALFKAELTSDETRTLYEAGKLIDLRPYLAENCPNLTALLAAHPEWEKDIALQDGAIVALPAIDELQFNNSMWINTLWLKNVGMAMPTTVDELTEVLRAFKKYDANLNGDSRDEVPLTFMSLWDLRFLAHGFGVNANDYYMTVQEGVVSQTLTTDANRAFLTWLNTLWTEGLLDLNGFSGLRDMSISAGTSEDSPAVYGVMFAGSPASMVPSGHLEEYALLMPLTYEGRQVYRDLTGDVIRGTFAITSVCKDPAALLRWVDLLYTEEGFVLSEIGREDVEYSVNDDGTWLWLETGEVLTSEILPNATIRSGASMPGYASVAFQQKIDNAATVRIIDELLRLKAVDTMPYPLVDLTKEQQSRIAELHGGIGKYAETQMVWFVVGDVPLNDETWAAFCAQVQELGIEEEVSIWQEALDARMKK